MFSGSGLARSSTTERCTIDTRTANVVCYPKFVPPCLNQYLPKNGFAMKRTATGDCGFGGSSAHSRNYASAFVVNVATSGVKVIKYYQQKREEESNVDAKASLTGSQIPF